MIKNSTDYIILEYGTGVFGNLISGYTKDYCPDCDAPSHVGFLIHRGDLGLMSDWWVYESHMRGNEKLGIRKGVRHYDFERFKKNEYGKLKQFDIFPIKINRYELEYWLGEKYGTRDILALWRAGVLNREGKQKDKDGLICSEYAALVHDKICEHFDLPAHCISPAHWAQYLYDKGHYVRREECTK